ncbi:hypothetical protein BR93DRAFT_956592 [Coniochaeta sp. PMI_546]|nr:hypothetical protein BR93DRAFT_956592 [Coniochaeta sp. PMI_546]
MTALGVVRVALDDLDFPQPRQISFKVRQRLTKLLQALSKAGAAEIHLPCPVDEVKFSQILAHLGLSAPQLHATAKRGQKNLPLLSGIRLSCLYGDYPTSAARRAHDTILVVHLFSAEYGELYRKIIESYHRDEATFAACMISLTEPKMRNMRMLLRPKNLPLVRSINSLFEIPGLMEGLRLGNFHKWLALHIDEAIIAYLKHIHVVWKERICECKKTVMENIGIDDIHMLQFRMPKVCSDDADTIKRLIDNGTLFMRIGDPSDRAMLRRNLLVLDVVIPTFETLQENMKYITIGAKILTQHVLDEIPLCKGRTKRSLTIFERLSSSWTPPEITQVEAGDNDMKEIEEEASPSLAFMQLFLACLRLFAWLQDAYAPREDWPEDNFKPGIQPPCVAYILHFAFVLGYRTTKILDAQSVPDHHPGPRLNCPWEAMPDWRGGRPFTRTFWALRSNGFLPKLTAIRCQPNPEFILLDMLTAFFGKHNITLKSRSEPSVESVENMGSGDIGNRLDQEDQQMNDIPVPPPSQLQGDQRTPESQPKSRLAKPFKPGARGIASREAARSVIGAQIETRKRDTTRRKQPLPSITPQFRQAMEKISSIRSAIPQDPQLGSSASNHDALRNNSERQHEAIDSSRTAPNPVTFGREAARSVFVANPNWKIPQPSLPQNLSSQGIGEALTSTERIPPASYNFSTRGRPKIHESISRPDGPASETPTRFIAPIRGMKLRPTRAPAIATPSHEVVKLLPRNLVRHGKHFVEEDLNVSIRKEQSQGEVSKRRRVGTFENRENDEPRFERGPSSSEAVPQSRTAAQSRIQPAIRVTGISENVAGPSSATNARSITTPQPDKTAPISVNDKGKQPAVTLPPEPISQEGDTIFSAQSNHFPATDFAQSAGEFELDSDDGISETG